MKKSIALLFYCFMVSLLLASPVWAAICGEGFNEGFSCCDSDSCYGGNHGQQDCMPGKFCCESCTSPGGEGGITNPVIGLFGTQAGELTIAYILATLLRLALVVAGILLLLYIVVGGIQWLTSGGEKTALAAARDRITAAFIGLVLIVLVVVIIEFINQVLFKGEFDILRPTLPKPE